MRHSLPSGCYIRKLHTGDQPEYLSFMQSLDKVTRWQRFHAGVSDDYIADHSNRAFANGSVLHGVFRDEKLVGVAELYVGWPKLRAEAAFAVHPTMQGMGIGTALMDATILSARNRRCRSIRILCLRDNFAMRKIAQKAQAKFMIELDEIAAEIKPAAPNFFTWLQEAMADARPPMAAFSGFGFAR